MTCSRCGAEILEGGYFCGACGRPVETYSPAKELLVDEASLEEVPAPVRSAEIPDGVAERKRRALCCVCLGAFPVVELCSVDGQDHCPSCSPVRASHVPAEHPIVSDPGRGEAVRVAGPPPRIWRAPTEVRAGRGLRVVLGLLVLALVGGGIYLVVFALGQDRIDKLLAGVDSDREDARLLIYQYRVGETLRYGLRMDMEMKVEGGSLGEEETKLKLEMGIAVRTLSVDEQGNAEQELRMESVEFDVESGRGGQPDPQLLEQTRRMLEGTSVRARVDPFGKILEEPVFDGPAGLGSMTGGMFSPRMTGMDDVPRHRLGVGESWTSRAAMPGLNGGLGGLGAAGSLEYEATFTVEGYKELQGRDCMVISIEGELECSASGGRLRVGVDLDGTMKGAIFFDPDAGVLVKQAVDVELEFSAESLGLSVEGEARFSLDIDLE